MPEFIPAFFLATFSGGIKVEFENRRLILVGWV